MAINYKNFFVLLFHLEMIARHEKLAQIHCRTGRKMRRKSRPHRLFQSTKL